ncbi:hypothetical protein CMV_005962 [Castanea mollissima]|uniref:Disease resistance R13L4/SHOC-2-like LRR domain-containing protein n=1 Tax=Castanea mollissima TaxID=60419 RepID=A0A8J4RCB3_9ROSI|nr:hypothetical protein CMV_005962 [Castanea mollissima]
MRHSSVVVVLIVIENKDIIYASPKSVCKFFMLMLESLNNINVFVTTGVNIIQPLDLVGKYLLQFKELGLTSLVRNLTRIEYLDLSGVNIFSTVPNIFANFSTLRSLYLHDCGMHGEFPKGIFKLPNLVVLDMKYNEVLTGSWPDFQNWSSPLEDMTLAGTSFSGELPASMGNLGSLITLDMWNCNISGPIPFSLGNLTNLSYLKLSNNTSVGNIPSSIGNLIQLTFLDLYGNQLTGPILFELANMTQLTILSLGSNQLTSSIPFGLAKTPLSFLHLGFNELTNPILFHLTNLTQLTILDLGYNELTGPIPFGLRKLTRLNVLELAGNKFHGRFPILIFNLKSLKFLDMSDNHLSGLCGNPLSKKCWNFDSSPPSPSISEQSQDSTGFLFDFGWKIVLVGYGFGLIIGVIIGNIVVTRKQDWFMKTYGMKQWRRRNMRR